MAGVLMLHAKVDLTLAYHPKAHAAGPAMSTWTWALLHSREQELDGFIPAWSLRLSWCGERIAREHAKRLVEVGLFEASSDPEGWRLLRYEKKNETKAQIDSLRGDARERMQRVRTNRLRTPNRTSGEVPDSDSDSGSDLRERVQGEGVGERPPWFDEALATVEMTAGLSSTEAPALWLQYSAARLRKGWTKGREDAIGWLTSVLRSERREDQARKRPGREEPPSAPRQTRAEAKAFADEIAAKMRELKVGGA